jgi:hypothetical protein
MLILYDPFTTMGSARLTETVSVFMHTWSAIPMYSRPFNVFTACCASSLDANLAVAAPLKTPVLLSRRNWISIGYPAVCNNSPLRSYKVHL